MRHTSKLCIGVSDNGEPCTNIGDFGRGYCNRCYLILRDHCIRNGSWPLKRGEEIARSAPPKWEYEPTPEQEAELAAMFGQSETEPPKEK